MPSHAESGPQILIVTSNRADAGFLLPLFRRLENNPHLRASILALTGHDNPAHSPLPTLKKTTLPCHLLDCMGDRAQNPATIAAQVLVSVDGALGRSTTEPAAAKPATNSTTKPVTNSATKPTTKPATKLATKPTTRLATKPATNPATNPANKPANKPDGVILAGDRYEIMASAIALTLHNQCIIHIGGGAQTLGAFDDQFRNAITQCAQLHCAETKHHAARLRQLGVPAARIALCGALGIDAAKEAPEKPWTSLIDHYALPFTAKPILATLHPETRPMPTESVLRRQFEALASALLASGVPVVWTAPNPDPQGQKLESWIQNWCRQHSSTQHYIASFGDENYFAMLRHARAMVGNSSSGIIESSAFGVPSLSVGARQSQRPAPRNVKHSGFEAGELRQALEATLSPQFDSQCRQRLDSLYGVGKASYAILEAVQALLALPAEARARQD